MELNNADRIANEGPVLTLMDGRQLRLHFGFGGLRQIEKRFGSLNGLVQRLSGGEDSAFFDTIFTGLLCGLWKTGITEDDLEENLDPAEIEQYGIVLSEAIALAFPKKVQEAVNAPQVAETTGTPSGPNPSTSPVSSSASTGTTSGT